MNRYPWQHWAGHCHVCFGVAAAIVGMLGSAAHRFVRILIRWIDRKKMQVRRPKFKRVRLSRFFFLCANTLSSTTVSGFLRWCISLVHLQDNSAMSNRLTCSTSSSTDLKSIGCKMTWPSRIFPFPSPMEQPLAMENVQRAKQVFRYKPKTRNICPRPSYFSRQFFKFGRLLG